MSSRPGAGRSTGRALATVVVAGCATVALSSPSTTATDVAATTTASPASLSPPRTGTADSGRSRNACDEWQPHGWADVDGNGCNTRQEVLAESSVPPRRDPGCPIDSGEWADRYTGPRVTSAAALEINHLVALADAHASERRSGLADARVVFANDTVDPDELYAPSGSENQRKADGGPDLSLPPHLAFRSAYMAAYAAIKPRWGLSIARRSGQR